MCWLTGITFVALLGMAAFIPYIGLLFMAFVSSGLMFTSFFTSHYLNRITESHQRATVLSFKGLAFNLAYGLIGILFAGLMAKLRDIQVTANPQWSETMVENSAFTQAIGYLTPYTAIILLIILCISAYLLRFSAEHRRRG